MEGREPKPEWLDVRYPYVIATRNDYPGCDLIGAWVKNLDEAMECDVDLFNFETKVLPLDDIPAFYPDWDEYELSSHYEGAERYAREVGALDDAERYERKVGALDNAERFRKASVKTPTTTSLFIVQSDLPEDEFTSKIASYGGWVIYAFSMLEPPTRLVGLPNTQNAEELKKESWVISLYEDKSFVVSL